MVRPLPATTVEGAKRLAQRVDAGESVHVCGVCCGDIGVETRNGAEFLLEEIASRLGHPAVCLVVFVVLYCGARIRDILGEEEIVDTHSTGRHVCFGFAGECDRISPNTRPRPSLYTGAAPAATI